VRFASRSRVEEGIVLRRGNKVFVDHARIHLLALRFEAASRKEFRGIGELRIGEAYTGLAVVRQGGGVVAVAVVKLSDAIGGGADEFTRAELLEQRLVAAARGIEGASAPVAFREAEKRGLPARAAGVKIQVFLILWRGHVEAALPIVTIGDVKLELIRPHRRAARRDANLARRVAHLRHGQRGGLRHGAGRGLFFHGHGGGDGDRRGGGHRRGHRRRAAHWLGPADFRLGGWFRWIGAEGPQHFLSERDRASAEQGGGQADAGGREPAGHSILSVAKATFQMPASRQMSSTFTMAR
jgi:hypothetical protein